MTGLQRVSIPPLKGWQFRRTFKRLFSERANGTSFRVSGVLAAILATAVPSAIAQSILLAGGTVADGTGGPLREADLLIENGTITFIGDADEVGVSAERSIDVSGLVVAPGFIDPHTHALSDLSDIRDPQRRQNANYLYQGVTTVMVGNDGAGPFDVERVGETLDNIGIGTNAGLLVGLGPVREAVIGKADRVPTPDELMEMMALVRKAMREGALGFSTGLYYAPQSFASTEEVIALASVAAKYGGLYDTHIRDESTYSIGLLASIDEAINIGRSAAMPVHIAHVKALGPDVWGASNEIIRKIEAARNDGVDVTADQYPWLASGTRISNALFPRWALDGGIEELRRRLKEPETRAKLKAELVENLRRRAGADALLLTAPLEEAPAGWRGQTLAEVANRQNAEPVDVVMSLMERGDYRVASFIMSNEDVLRLADQDWIMTGSDGTTGHPRKYGSFPKAYEELVEKHGLLNLPQFVRRSSARAADAFGLHKRGYLKEGFVADVLVLDPEEYKSRASYQNPERLATGVIHLFVNGRPTIEHSALTGEFAGRVLRRKTDQTDGRGQ